MTQLSLSSAGVSLRAVLADVARGGRMPEVRATSCTGDWRHARPGDVFVALAGAEEDGHDRAEEAVHRGAVAVVCERPLPLFDVPQILVADSRLAYGRLCQALMGNPSRQLKVIGVTGTHGKTTVARLLTAIFRAAGGSVGTLDSYGYWDGIDDRPPADTPLSPPVLARSLAEMVAAGATHAVVEVTSRELSQHALAGVTLDAVCLTQVGRGRLDWHGSLHNYRNAKRRIFDYLHRDGVAILNADDPTSVEILCDLNHPALTFGMRLPAEITAQIVEQQINEQTFVLSAGDESAGVRAAMIGDHHVYNCLAAATLALTYGIDLGIIARGLEGVDRLPGRMERVMCGQEFTVLIDAADSPDALRSCLRAARQAASRRVLCMYGPHDECDPSELPASGRVVGALADEAVVSCTRLRSGFAVPQKARVITDRAEAIARTLQAANPGDVVVIAGMGERPHTIRDGARANDRELVQCLLHAQLTTSSLRRLAA